VKESNIVNAQRVRLSSLPHLSVREETSQMHRMYQWYIRRRCMCEYEYDMWIL